MRVVSLVEHQSAKIDKDLSRGATFTTSEIDALAQSQNKLGVEAFRWVDRTHIKTAQFVGVLTAPGIQLEILPKIGTLNGPETRHILVKMIANALEISLYDGQLSGHHYQHEHLLELIVTLFSRKLLEQARKGVSHQYNRYTDDLPKLRGKLNVHRQFSCFAATPQTLACEFDEFTADTPLNRLLLCTVHLLRRCSRSLENQRRLNEVEVYFNAVSQIQIPDVLSEKIYLGRNQTRWRELQILAELILRSSYQTVHTGLRSAFSLLFDMNVLFESYIAAQACRNLSPKGYKITTQHPVSSLGIDSRQRKAFYTRPDIFIEKDNIRIIIDTKWKVIAHNQRNYGLSQADVYQMYGYSGVYQAHATLLLYPECEVSVESDAWKFTGVAGTLYCCTFDLSNTSAALMKLCSFIETLNMETPDQ